MTGRLFKGVAGERDAGWIDIKSRSVFRHVFRREVRFFIGDRKLHLGRARVFDNDNRGTGARGNLMYQPLVSAEVADHPATSMEVHHRRKRACDIGRANNVNRQIAVRATGDHTMLDLRWRSFEGVGENNRHCGSHLPGFRRRHLVQCGPRRACGEQVEKLACDRVRRSHQEIIAAFAPGYLFVELRSFPELRIRRVVVLNPKLGAGFLQESLDGRSGRDGLIRIEFGGRDLVQFAFLGVMIEITA